MCGLTQQVSALCTCHRPGLILNAQPAFNSTSLFFCKVLKVAEPSEFFPPVLCAASPFPRSGCWEVKRERADGVAFSKKCGITGASWWGDGERNCARCVDRVGGGERMGWEALEKREGRGHLNYLCSLWPRSPSVSLWTDPLSERRGAFPQADAHPPPLFEIAFAPSAELQKLNCNNLFSNAFLLYLSLSKISILPLKKKEKIKAFFEGGKKPFPWDLAR